MILNCDQIIKALIIEYDTQSLTQWHLTRETRAPSQYPKRRLSVRSRKVSKPRDLYLELSDRSEIWQALRQHCCRCACQISKRYDNSKYQSSRQVVASRLYEILRKDFFSDIETEPRLLVHCSTSWPLVIDYYHARAECDFSGQWFLIYLMAVIITAVWLNIVLICDQNGIIMVLLLLAMHWYMFPVSKGIYMFLQSYMMM